MKKRNLIGILATALCSIFVFAGCAPAAPAATEAPSASSSAAPGGALILGAKGEITEITSANGTTSLTVNGGGIESEATYNLLIANMTDNVVVEIDGKQENFSDGMLGVGDIVEIYLGEGNPVTASEPPMATPDKVVVTQKVAAAGESGAPAAVQTEFEGTITEITPDNDYYLVYVQKEEGGEPVNDLIAVASSDTTIVSEKLEASGLKPEELKVGDKVTVTTDGRMTFSIPPQSSAVKIVIHDAEAK